MFRRFEAVRVLVLVPYRPRSWRCSFLSVPVPGLCLFLALVLVDWIGLVWIRLGWAGTIPEQSASRRGNACYGSPSYYGDHSQRKRRKSF